MNIYNKNAFDITMNLFYKCEDTSYVFYNNFLGIVLLPFQLKCLTN